MINRFDMRLKTQGEVLKFARHMVSSEVNSNYINKIYKLLLSIEPDSKLEIDPIVKAVNMDYFIKTTCLFMCENPNKGYCFSDDYNFIERRKEEVHKPLYPKL